MTNTENKMDLYDQLRNEITNLSTSLLDTLFVLDTKIFHQSKTLQSDYIKKLGETEFKSFLLQNDISRTKKKIDILKEIIKEGKYADHEFIEKAVDIDFKENIERMQEQADLIKIALQPSPALKCSSKELIMIDKTYKNLLQNLYPDFVKEFTPKINENLKQAIEAYINYDLLALKKLQKQVDPVVILEKEVLEETAKIERCTELLKTKSTFETKLANAQKQLTTIDKSFPFNVRGMLLNETELKQRQLELKNQITHYTKYFNKYKEEYTVLIEQSNKINKAITLFKKNATKKDFNKEKDLN